jgi:hypothetical protein
MESCISPPIFKEDPGFNTYIPIERTGLPIIDEFLEKLENCEGVTGSVSYSRFNELDFPYNQQWLDEKLPALMARFPFEDIDLNLIIKNNEGVVYHKNSENDNPLYNGDLKDDYALNLKFQRLILTPGVTEKQRAKMPEELMKLTLRHCDKDKTVYFKNSLNVEKKYTYAPSHLKEAAWFDGEIDGEVVISSLYTEDVLSHYDVTMNFLGQSNNRNQIQKLGGKKGDGYSPFINLMNKTLTGIGPDKTYSRTKILKEFTKVDGARLKSRTEIKLHSKQQYKDCGITAKKNHPIIDERQMDPFVLSIYMAIGRNLKLIDTICGIKPKDQTPITTWSPIQDNIREYGANEETSQYIFDIDTFIKQLTDPTHHLLRKSELTQDHGWNQLWDVKNDCVKVIQESETESEESDEEIKSESDEEIKSESDEEIKSESDEEIKSESIEEKEGEPPVEKSRVELIVDEDVYPPSTINVSKHPRNLSSTVDTVMKLINEGKLDRVKRNTLKSIFDTYIKPGKSDEYFRNEIKRYARQKLNENPNKILGGGSQLVTEMIEME